MKLDRNTNRGGRGKYALVNMRKLIPTMEAMEKIEAHPEHTLEIPNLELMEDVKAFERLVKRGVISLGNETPGDQFFVMKYKDIFTAAGLRAYAQATKEEAERIGSADVKRQLELLEYADQMHRESIAAERVGYRIPD